MLMFLIIFLTFDAEISFSDSDMAAKVSAPVIKYNDSSKQLVNKPIIINVLQRIRNVSAHAKFMEISRNLT